MASRQNTVHECTVFHTEWQILGSVQRKAELSSTLTESSFLQNNLIHFRDSHMFKTSAHAHYSLRAKCPVLYAICTC